MYLWSGMVDHLQTVHELWHFMIVCHVESTLLIHIILNSFCYELSLINSLVMIINTQVDYMTLKKH